MKKSDFDNYLETSNQAAALIRNNLERTAELVRSFKQISVDQSSDEQRTFNVNEYIHQTLTSIHNAIKQTDIEIKINCDADLVLSSYPGALSQIITNLVLNASIHAFDNAQNFKQIEITAYRETDMLNMTVTDNGKGILPQVKQKIFDPFFTTNRDNGGSGLGLNIVFNIVTSQLKGEIKCDSELGHGAKFSIKFPFNVN
ncbi:HAMP domain-containing histidine kinase [Psychrobium sp. MM17-31]|uniref:sensor histidine kinase n=1 Tax=Psychrobium sp. MM17-31 TaxID=2917758 RepID=UPI001EF71E11|nr:HAMP domain-containing sensor histidine kinase [Psychrobium sp. MM17-31]MCG7530596.1 HAMP domain-containing histidine kinase [Psychrobium sp. MM17-31]